MIPRKLVLSLALALAPSVLPTATAQTAHPGSLADFSRSTSLGGNATDWAIPTAAPQDIGTGGTGGQARSGALPQLNPQEGFPPLNPADRNYDPLNLPDLERRVPSSCAEAGSPCQQCVRSAEDNIQFNRRYLHVAWSITNAHLAYADRMIRFGDTGSGFHGAMAMSWQLGGKPQIEEAVAQLRETYRRKYGDYMQNIRRSLDKLAACEQENFATQDLYRLYSQMYYDMLVMRYEKVDP